MHRRRVCAVVGVPFLILFLGTSSTGQGARQGAPANAAPPQINVETFYPRHAGVGRTTVINIAVPRGNEVTAAEISPAAGVTVSRLTGTAGATEQAIGWWEVTLDVAKDAAPGERSLVLVLQRGRTAPITVSMSAHIPAISDLRIAPQANAAGLELQVAASDTANDLGESPYIWFSADCGVEPIVGTLRSKVNARVVRTPFPDLRKAAADNAPANARCEIQVRLTDSAGIESNTLKTMLELKN